MVKWQNGSHDGNSLMNYYLCTLYTFFISQSLDLLYSASHERTNNVVYVGLGIGVDEALRA